MSAENRLTSIVSYPERGTGGNNRYRGNCSPKLIEDLIGFFRPAEICDYMCGSGTTQDAAHSIMSKSSHIPKRGKISGGKRRFAKPYNAVRSSS